MKQFIRILTVVTGFNSMLSQVMALQEDSIPKRLQAFMVEINEIQIEQYKIKDLPLNQALDLAFSLTQNKSKYLAGYKLNPILPSRTISLAVEKVSFGALILMIANQAVVRVDEKDGTLFFEEITSRGDELIVVPLKKAVVEKLGLGKDKAARDIFEKFSIKTMACEFSSERNLLAVKADHYEAETLRAFLLLTERGYSIAASTRE